MLPPHGAWVTKASMTTSPRHNIHKHLNTQRNIIMLRERRVKGDEQDLVLECRLHL